jgi:hypothetical protein
MNPKKKKTSVVQKTVVAPMYMTRIPNSDLADGYRELSPYAFMLLTYYYSKGDGWEFNIDVMAEVFGLTERTVANRIKELKNKGYLLHVKGDIDNYIVGKIKVGEYS